MVTQFIKNATYKEIYDIHTDSESTSILTLHTPINSFPRAMLGGFFKQYRKFRYRGATIRMVPAARLPADPEQISYEAGEMGIDPRDMLNPVLFHGYSGESLGTFLNNFNVAGGQKKQQQVSVGGNYDTFVNDGWFGNSVDKASFFDQANAMDWRSAYLHRLYYESLGDNSFRKIRPQSGFRKFLYPLVYELATTTQRLAHNPFTDTGSDSTTYPAGLVYGRPIDATSANAGANNIGIREGQEVQADAGPTPSETYTNVTTPTAGTVDDPFASSAGYFMDGQTLPVSWVQSNSSSQAQSRWYIVRKTTPILTSHKRRLGWLDTDSVVVPASSVEPSFISSDTSWSGYGYPPNAVMDPTWKNYASATTLPLINMGILIFPKAYKQEFFWRMEITHHFDFSKYRPLHGLISPFDYSTFQSGPILEWSDWDSYGDQTNPLFPVSSLTSTSANVKLVDVEGLGYSPEGVGGNIPVEDESFDADEPVNPEV